MLRSRVISIPLYQAPPTPAKTRNQLFKKSNRPHALLNSIGHALDTQIPATHGNLVADEKVGGLGVKVTKF